MDSTALYFIMIYVLIIAILVLVIYMNFDSTAIEFFRNPDPCEYHTNRE